MNVEPGTRDSRGFRVFGELAEHPLADEVASKSHALLVRYTTEVVAAYRLCPFLKTVGSGLGAVGVMMDVKPDVERAVAAILELSEPVVHLVYPLFAGPDASTFERFGNKLAEALRKARREPLVHASFHPEMVGGTENAHRLIGLLRQSPDAFVQFIPPGLQEGGTVLSGEEASTKSHADERYGRLMKDSGVEAGDVLAKLADLKRARAQEYGSLAETVAAGLRPPLL